MKEETIWDIIKPIVIALLALFSLFGIVFISHINEIPTTIEYYENDTKVDAIRFHNEIYLKKGE